jgi:hypothetical protein
VLRSRQIAVADQGQPFCAALTPEISSLMLTLPSPSTSHALQLDRSPPSATFTQLINSLICTSLLPSQSSGQVAAPH